MTPNTTTIDPFARPVRLPVRGAMIFHTEDMTLLGSPLEVAAEMHSRALFLAALPFRDYCEGILRALAANGVSVLPIGDTADDAARAVLQSLLDAGRARLRPVGTDRN